jgi:hypothetical protein
MATADGASFCIYDTAKKKATWVGLNESGQDFVVKEAGPDADSVTVDYQGRSLHLTLVASKVSSAGGAAGAITSSVAVNPTPADEQKRLDAVSQEVRRRRMERERALQGGPGRLPPGPDGAGLPGGR